MQSVQTNGRRPLNDQKPYLTLKARKGWSALNLRELWLFREVVLTLATRDLKLRYKQTALGAIWVILQPLLAAGIFSFVFGTVAGLGSDGRPYFLFSYAGLLGWKLFQGTVTPASLCMVENADLVSKVYFPRLALPISTIPSNLVDFGVALMVMAALMFGYGVQPNSALLLLPVWAGILLMLSAGTGMILSALTVQYRDVKHILPVFVQMLLYLSPVAYAVSEVPRDYRNLFSLNPLVAPLEGFRWSLLGTRPPLMEALVYSAVVASVVLAFGAMFFKRVERNFADVI
jgi:lipopolysaccharide transport system permease protein